MEKSLEKISWQNGEWISSLGKKVNPIPIGNLTKIKMSYEERDIKKCLNHAGLNENQVNAYETGSIILVTRDLEFNRSRAEENYLHPIRFYKI